MDFKCSMCEWTTPVVITAGPHPYLKDFTINLAAEDRARLMTHMEQHPEWPMFPQLGEVEK